MEIINPYEYAILKNHNAKNIIYTRNKYRLGIKVWHILFLRAVVFQIQY